MTEDKNVKNTHFQLDISGGILQSARRASSVILQRGGLHEMHSRCPAFVVSALRRSRLLDGSTLKTTKPPLCGGLYLVCRDDWIRMMSIRY